MSFNPSYFLIGGVARQIIRGRIAQANAHLSAKARAGHILASTASRDALARVLASEAAPEFLPTRRNPFEAAGA